jgi:DNA polymerase phi
MSTTLPLLWDLSSASKQKRLDSSAKLIETLQHFQNEFVEANSTDGVAPPATSNGWGDGDDSESGEEVDGSDDDEEEQAGELAKEGKKLDRTPDAKHAEDARYSIRRLVRGLASPRESSRLGFAVALTEVRLLTFVFPFSLFSILAVSQRERFVVS